MNHKLLTLALSLCVCLILVSTATSRNGANVSITSGKLFIDDQNGLDHRVGHLSTYTYTVQIESDANITGSTLGFLLYSPNGSLSNVIWNSVPANIGVWGEGSTWNFGGAWLVKGPDDFNGSLPSAWMTGGVSIPGTGSGYGPIGLTDGLEFTITFPGIDGGVLCLDSAFFPTAGTWLASPVQKFEWGGGRGDLSVGGSRDHAFCVTTFIASTVAPCPSSVLLNHCDTLHYQTFADDPDSSNQSLTYSVTSTGKGVASVDTAGIVTYIPSPNEFVGLLITLTTTAPDGTTFECNTAVSITNHAPALTCPPDIVIIEGNTNTSPPANVSEADACDSHEYSLASVDPIPQGVVSVNPTTGAVTFATDSSDAIGDIETVYTVCISASDDYDSDQCCLTYTVLPYIPPCPDSVSITHCDVLRFRAFAIDLDPTKPTFTYSVTHNGAGIASVDTTGFVTFIPAIKETGEVNITVTATGADGLTDECITVVSIHNNPPTLVCPPNVAFVKGKSSVTPPANGSDADACDALVYSLVSVTPTPIGIVSVNSATGAVTFTPDIADAVGGVDTPYDICIEVTDGITVTQCCMSFTVLNTEAFCISIDQTNRNPIADGTLQGHLVDICINYDGGSNEIGGFDFLISYDNVALTFVGATEGNIYPDYQWEYFTFRFGPNGDCSGGCPSGKLRIIGLAEQNDGMHHPLSTQLVAGDQFACLTFLVSNDRNVSCQFAPIRWDWIDCKDNTLSSPNGDTLYVSRNVYDYIGTDYNNLLSGGRADITGADQSFPTATGALDSCDFSSTSSAQLRFIDYKNGGVKIICYDNFVDRGDVNLNGIANEIADAFMLQNYFVSGLSAFVGNPEGSIAASEVNCDGKPITVADLVYLTRVITGRAIPQCTSAVITDDTVVIATGGSIVSSNKTLGAALFVFAGEVTPALLANNMDLRLGVVDGNTHALVWTLPSVNVFEFINPGPVLQTDAELLSVDASDTLGATLAVQFDFITDVNPVDNSALPKSFALHQNYPNPFNPKTTMTIDFPRRSAYTLTIYNIRGQKVKSFSGTNSTGVLKVVWEPKNAPSGVYFYKLRAGDFSATKKLVLLK